MIKARIRWCRQIVKSVVLFPPPFYFVFYISNLLSYIQNNFSYELARPIGNHFSSYYIILKIEKMENLFNFFNINFAKARSQSFCFLQLKIGKLIFFFLILILKSHGHKRFCFLQYIDF